MIVRNPESGDPLVVRPLQKSDFNTVKGLLAQKATVMSVDKTKQGANLSSFFAAPEADVFYEAFLDEEYKRSNSIAFGVFDREDLQYVIGVYFSTATNSWYWRRLFGRDKCSSPLMLRTLFYYVAEYAESMGYMKFYTMFPSQWHKPYERLLRVVSPARKYRAFLDTFIPAKTKPPFTDYWSILMGSQLWDVDLCVYLYVSRKYESTK